MDSCSSSGLASVTSFSRGRQAIPMTIDRPGLFLAWVARG